MRTLTDPEHLRAKQVRMVHAEARADAAHQRALEAGREAAASPWPHIAEFRLREQSAHLRAERLHRAAADLQRAHIVEEEAAFGA